MNKEKIIQVTAGLTWIIGLLAAGSESPYMPWANILGALVFLGISIYIGHFFSRSEPMKKPLKKRMAARQVRLGFSKQHHRAKLKSSLAFGLLFKP